MVTQQLGTDKTCSKKTDNIIFNTIQTTLQRFQKLTDMTSKMLLCML
jgi:hypothetical protein